MYIYHGKLNYLQYAVNEEFTIVLPKGSELGDPACAFWQWTVDGGGVQKRNMEYIGLVDSVTQFGTTKKFGLFYDEYYHFDCEPSADGKTLTVTITSSKGDKPVSNTLELIYPTSASGGSTNDIGCDVFTGKLNWYNSAKNEMITLIFPVVDAFETPAVGVWQWTVNAQGVKKFSNVFVQNALDSNVKAGGVRTLSFFQDQFYKFSGELSADMLSMTVTLSDQNVADRWAPSVLNRSYHFSAV